MADVPAPEPQDTKINLESGYSSLSRLAGRVGPRALQRGMTLAPSDVRILRDGLAVSLAAIRRALAAEAEVHDLRTRVAELES